MEDKTKLIVIRSNDGGIIKFESHTALTSTSALARHYAQSGYPDRFVVFCDKRILEDGEIENGLYMSILLRPSLFSSQAALLNAMSATAMITALEGHTDKRLGIGWISDLFCEGVKIGSSTVEGKLDSYSAYEYLIINYSIKLTESDFPPRLNDMIREVFESDNTSISMIMAKSILAKFFALYVNYKTSSKFMSTYSEKFIFRGLRGKYRDGTKKRNLRVLNIDAKTCALVLEGRGGQPLLVYSPRNVILPKKVRVK